MNINTLFIIFAVLFIACIAYFCMSISKLKMDVKADRENMNVIIKQIKDINDHCGHVIKAMELLISLVNDELEQHSKALDAINIAYMEAEDMTRKFLDLKNEFDICQEHIVNLNDRLDDFDLMRNIKVIPNIGSPEGAE